MSKKCNIKHVLCRPKETGRNLHLSLDQEEELEHSWKVIFDDCIWGEHSHILACSGTNVLVVHIDLHLPFHGIHSCYWFILCDVYAHILQDAIGNNINSEATGLFIFNTKKLQKFIVCNNIRAISLLPWLYKYSYLLNIREEIHLTLN